MVLWPFCDHFWQVCDHFVTILWPLIDHFVTILWLLHDHCDHLMITLWPHCCHFGTIFGTTYRIVTTLRPNCDHFVITLLTLLGSLLESKCVKLSILARKFNYETFIGNFQTLWIIRHKNNHQRWIAWKPKRQVTSVTVTPHSTLGLNFNPSTSFNPSPKLEFNPDPTENSISTENSVEENLNSIITESF